MQKRLELTWFGKDEIKKIEPRILVADLELSIGEDQNDNFLINGDNLLALKALESRFAQKIMCIYIDPPYNTGNAFDNYDDNIEHSIWLSLMKERLVILYNLMKMNGTIFIQVNDDEQAYLKVLMDEIFGRSNFINMISIKAKASSGASGGGEDRKLKKNVEYILVYAKSDQFDSFKPQYSRTLLSKYIQDRDDNDMTFAYKSVMTKLGDLNYLGDTQTGNGDTIKVYKVEDFEIKSIAQIMREEKITRDQVYSKYIKHIFTTENAQTSIRQRVKDYVGVNDGYYVAEYIPLTGRNKGKLIQVGFIGRTKRLVSWLNPLVDIVDGAIYKLDKIGTLWDDISWSSVHLEGGVRFKNGKKPEALVKRILEMATDEGDYVLDSFLGSGTTCAVAHKMRRKWIGIEMGEQAFTHCQPRLKSIVEGTDQTGISSDCGWSGGGGFGYYKLAPSLIMKDDFGNEIINKEYNSHMLAEAVAKHENFEFNPNTEFFWKQSLSSDKSFLFVTTNYVTVEYVQYIHSQMKEEEYLLICCKKYDNRSEKMYKSIKIKKIPQSILGKCEYGVSNYNLNIVEAEDDEEDFQDASE